VLDKKWGGKSEGEKMEDMWWGGNVQGLGQKEVALIVAEWGPDVGTASVGKKDIVIEEQNTLIEESNTLVVEKNALIREKNTLIGKKDKMIEDLEMQHELDTSERETLNQKQWELQRIW
jgi:hypothetical protein